MDWLDPQTEFPKGRSGEWIVILAVILLLHFLLSRLSSDFIGTGEEAKNAPPIELTQVPEKWTDSKKPVVQTSKARKQEEDAKEPKFAGEFRNQVKKETLSKFRGKFNESRRSGSPEPLGKEGDKLPGPSMSDLMPFSTNPQKLDGIDPGNETVLNTEPVLYASFMNRIANEIYDIWVRRVREALAHHQKLDLPTYTTVLQIEMNKNGDITGISLMKTSGIDDFDRAPQAAFWEVKQFPNPPAALIQQDGFIRFTYQFSIETGRSGFNILPFNI